MNVVALHGTVNDERLLRWQTNRGDWRAEEQDGEGVLALPRNPTTDWRGGTVAISGDAGWRDYEYSLELCLMGEGMAWPGVIIRAQDTDNYELFWFMPHLEDAEAGNVAYLSVAHDTVPWWTDSYVAIPRGAAVYRRGEWLPISIRCEGLEASVRVRNEADPIFAVRLTYYLDGGRVGVYCGTGTTARFRRMKVRLLPPSPQAGPPDLAPRPGGPPSSNLR